MPVARIGDIDLFFEIRGTGPRLLFIGGTGGDLRKAPTAFDRLLDAHFEVLRFDQRGMGQSAKPDVPYTMADYAADAAGLLDHLGWGSVAVLGYSFGGMVAQELALQQPEKVARLALLSTTAGGAGGASWPLHTMADSSMETRARAMIELGDTRRDAAWQAAHPALFAAMMEDQLAGLRLTAQDPGGTLGARRQIEARKHHDTFERLPQLAMPVAVFAGEHDAIAPPAAVTNMARQIPGAVLQFFEGGHLMHVPNKDAARAIVGWLSEA